MTKKLFLFSLLFSLLLIGCSENSTDIENGSNEGNVFAADETEIIVEDEFVVGAMGVVDTQSHEILSWNVYGEIEDLYISVGDFVSEGDVLAVLNEESVYNEEAEDSEELSYQDLIQAYTIAINAKENFYEGYSEMDIAEKELAIANQQKIVFVAEYVYQRDLNKPTQSKIDEATSRLIIAEKELAEAQKIYDAFLWTRYKPEYATDEGYRLWLGKKWDEDIKIANAQQAYNEDYYAYLDVMDGISEEELAVMKADVGLQNEILIELENELNELLIGPSADDVLAIEEAVIDAKENLDVFELVAPFDGFITEVYAEDADVVSKDTKMLRIDNWELLVVEADVLEVDVDFIEIGDEVVIYFDSFVGDVFYGEIIEIGAVGESAKNITTFPVTVAIRSEVDGVLPGMTAIIDILVD